MPQEVHAEQTLRVKSRRQIHAQDFEVAYRVSVGFQVGNREHMDVIYVTGGGVYAGLFTDREQVMNRAIQTRGINWTIEAEPAEAMDEAGEAFFQDRG